MTEPKGTWHSSGYGTGTGTRRDSFLISLGLARSCFRFFAFTPLSLTHQADNTILPLVRCSASSRKASPSAWMGERVKEKLYDTRVHAPQRADWLGRKRGGKRVVGRGRQEQGRKLFAGWSTWCIPKHTISHRFLAKRKGKADRKFDSLQFIRALTLSSQLMGQRGDWES